MLSSVPSVANAHGWSEFPSARQNTCYEQGGIWSGTPPNAACAQAKDISGSYPFVQRNEYAKNVQDFNNINAVKAAIPDGTLCYANDSQKRGMGAPHTGWTRTELNTGTFEYVFNATAPHNPSFWEFYLTKPNADLSKGLAWGDLELIQEEGNVPVNGGTSVRWHKLRQYPNDKTQHDGKASVSNDNEKPHDHHDILRSIERIHAVRGQGQTQVVESRVGCPESPPSSGNGVAVNNTTILFVVKNER